ncbi:SET domain-containing protein [Cucurbitaria berberidis CBS 394.84]|uniref:SET domain-containing protein n=1 Tax=Cucurbitaria berberidis CBS 394.84 TaxID=1168544 RepID=A0A9P4GL54_9PLEO|nr:SET domain-containing protein [Cucurbitaria berberidis CBS 394.84]KAF1847667.1 SET domain-containing protein [Cucurbitaria berberidis CBS 394.84]
MKNEASDSSTVDKRKHAVFATEDIKQGTRIICEPPLITLPYPGADIRQLMHAYAKLPKYEQERIWDLDPSDLSASPLLETLAQLTEPILKRTVQIICKPKEDWTKEEAKDFEQSGTVLEQVLPTLRLAARWHASSRSMIDIPENERDKLPEGTPITGLFVETAGLRHSCVPNCYAHYNPVTDRMTVHTTRAIACGEELTLSSIAGIYYQTASVRASELKEKYGITCKCEACDSSHANFKKHEDARLRTNGRATLLGHFLTMLEIVDSDKVLKDLCLSSHIRPERQPSKEELENNAQTVLDLIKDLKVTGCEGPELIRWYNALIDRLQPRIAEALSGEKKLGLWKVILGRANGCELIAKRCFGEDSEEFKELQKRKERIAEVLMNAEEHAKTLKESKKKIIRS